MGHSAVIYFFSALALVLTGLRVVVHHLWPTHTWRRWWLVNTAFFVSLGIVGEVGLLLADEDWYAVGFGVALISVFCLRIARPWLNARRERTR